jgi:hypothetical protein
MNRALLSVSGLVLAALAASPAQAQQAPRFYTGMGIGTLSVSADAVDGGSFATTIAGGLSVARYLDVEVELVLPADDITTSDTAPSVSFAPPGASPAERDRLSVVTRFDRSRDVTSSLSAAVVLRPARGKRVTPGVIIGVFSQRVRDSVVYTPVSIPDGVDPAHPAVAARREDTTRTFGGPTIGGQVDIAVTPRLSVVPDVRYDYGSIGDEINNALRASVRVLFRF